MQVLLQVLFNFIVSEVIVLPPFTTLVDLKIKFLRSPIIRIVGINHEDHNS